MSSNIVDWAKRELDYAFAEYADDPLQQHANQNVLELLQVFSDQNHSGMSAPYVLRLFNRLANWKPIKPLTGEEDEWDEPDSDGTQQNKRCFQVFRNKHDNSTAFDVEGKVFIDDKDGISYHNRDSSIPVVFPYEVPDKPQYVHVNNLNKDTDEDNSNE